MEEVDRIVTVSRVRNDDLDVTGALLFTGERFVQLLEGPSEGIATLQRSIFRDGRHHKVTTIHHDDVSERKFLGWALAYAGPSRLVAKTVNDGIMLSERDPAQGSAVLVQLLENFSPLD